MTRPRLIIAIRCVTLLALCAFTDFGLYYFASFTLAPLALMMPPLSAHTCTIFEDDFSTDRTGTADYNIDSGSWTVSGGEISTGSAGSAIKEQVTDAITLAGLASAKGKVDTSGGKFRLFGAFIDLNTYIHCEVTINGASSTFKLFYHASAPDVQIGSTYTFTGSINTYYPLMLCWQPSGLSNLAVATFNGGEHVTSGSFPISGSKCGLGASPNGGTATFDDLLFIKNLYMDALCPDC